MTAISDRRLKAAIGFIFVTAVLDIVAMGIIIPVLPQLIEDFVGSNAQAGVINGVFVALWAGMQFVASPIIGSLSGPVRASAGDPAELRGAGHRLCADGGGAEPVVAGGRADRGGRHLV